MQETHKKGQVDSSSDAAGEQITTQVRQQANAWVVDFIGDLTKFAEQEVQNAYQQIPEQHSLFVLNFSQCEYINSAGIAVIISLITRARRKKQQVLAYGLSSHYHKLFYMVGLSDYIEICAGESEAIAKANNLPGALPT